MLVAIAYNAVPANAREDDRDVLVQAGTVRAALLQGGHTVELVPVTLDFNTFRETLRRLRPDTVFQLVETLAGSDRMAAFAAAIIEQSGLPLTGSSAEALWLSNHKTLAKRRLVMAGLPTAAWCELGGPVAGTSPMTFPERYIIKPVFEHASLGMDRSAIVRAESAEQLVAMVRQRALQLGQSCFAERFVDGREFNVSLLAADGGPEVLPLAEIDFSTFPPGKPRIVDYAAKWDPDSFEFHNTPRRFLEPTDDPELQQILRNLACRCWSEFELGGYVRVDFRVDPSGAPWILEINTNPCLSPDAGYRAALDRARIDFPVAVDRILRNSLRQAAAFSGARRQESPATATDQHADDSATPGASTAQRVNADEIQWRSIATAEDAQRVRSLVAATGYFYPDEVAVAEELVVERLAKGESSGYYFVFADRHGELLGYACYGPIACTRHSYDLYWIAVDRRFQGGGIGRLILEQAERQIAAAAGRRVYVETSNRAQYLSTRAFYERCGYTRDATLVDFYGPGDDKVIYVKDVAFRAPVPDCGAG